MSLKEANQVERELLFALREEYSFYQSLFIMLDKHKDQLRFNKDETLLDLYAEIERCYLRIKRSEEKIAEIKDKYPDHFKMIVASPEVKRILNSIITLVKKNVRLVEESEQYMQDRYQRIKSEVVDLKNSDKMMQYLSEDDEVPVAVEKKISG